MHVIEHMHVMLFYVDDSVLTLLSRFQHEMFTTLSFEVNFCNQCPFLVHIKFVYMYCIVLQF